jgi:uncharacterized Fe-S cluster-containing radical SAM superfamily enzyme
MQKIIKINSEIPLIGTIMFGLIDRGTNLIQVRPTSLCNLNCSYCSVDSGEKSKTRISAYIVERKHLVNWLKQVAECKGENLEANIDSVGEVLMYLEIIELVQDIKKIKQINKISMQTNGVLLTKEKINGLEKAGLDSINLSINSLDSELAKELSGCSWYDINKILEIAKEINNSKIELLLAPVYIKGINDNEIIKLIKLAKELGCKIGIQKYEVYKFGRKIENVKEMSWYKFYDQLKKWENEYKIKLRLGPLDFGIKRCKKIPKVFNKNDKIRVKIMLQGWMKNQMIGVANNRCITINNCNSKIGDIVNIKIIEDKNELYIGEVRKI